MDMRSLFLHARTKLYFYQIKIGLWNINTGSMLLHAVRHMQMLSCQITVMAVPPYRHIPMKGKAGNFHSTAN